MDDATVAYPELTPAVKRLLREASHLLTGRQRRAFLAQIADALLGGSARRAESHFDWNRDTVIQSQKEPQSGIVCLGDFHARGNHPVGAKWPELKRDVRALRRALIEEKGWRPAEVPAERTLRDVLQRPGYRWRAVAKTRPEKGRASARPSSPT